MNKNAVILSFLVMSMTSYAQTFPGVGVGAIPDGSGVPTTCGSGGAPLIITFDVSGVSAPLVAVEVDIEINHTWVNDLSVTLIAPSNEEHLLFGRTLALTAASCGGGGGGNDLVGIYNFTDSAAGTDWWTNAASGSPVPTGDFRTTESGGDGQVNPAPFTDMNAVFNSVADPNGTWRLVVVDGGVGDEGTITATNLFLMGGPNPDVIFENGFEEIIVM